MAATSQSASAALPTRQVAVAVLDREGRFIAGAGIAFLINGTAAGEISLSEGRASISLQDPSAALEVVATVNGNAQSVVVGQSDTAVDFVFAGLFGGRSVPTPEAKCWNGATGRPCVVCPIAGSSVRICC